MLPSIPPKASTLCKLCMQIVQGGVVSRSLVQKPKIRKVFLCQSRWVVRTFQSPDHRWLAPTASGTALITRLGNRCAAAYPIEAYKEVCISRLMSCLAWKGSRTRIECSWRRLTGHSLVRDGFIEIHSGDLKVEAEKSRSGDGVGSFYVYGSVVLRSTIVTVWTWRILRRSITDKKDSQWSQMCICRIEMDKKG